MVNEFKQALLRNASVPRGSTLVLGVSGGSDSVAMLRLFVEVAESLRLKIVVAHVNYHTRGRDSDADEKFVTALTQKYEMSLETLSIKRYKAEKTNFEEWAREIRYDFFQKVAKKHGAAFVAVAHTQDDQAETILMHLLKGAGINGLAAMKQREGNILRPLLTFSKKQLRGYLTTLKQPFRSDKTNADTKYIRNKVRHTLLPLLKKEFNPNIATALTRLSQSASDIEAFFNAEVQKFCAQHVKRTARRASFSRATFMQLPRSLRREVIHEIMRSFSVTEPLSFNHYNELERIFQRNVGNKQKEVSKNLKIMINGGVIRFVK